MSAGDIFIMIFLPRIWYPFFWSADAMRKLLSFSGIVGRTYQMLANKVIKINYKCDGVGFYTKYNTATYLTKHLFWFETLKLGKINPVTVYNDKC